MLDALIAEDGSQQALIFKTTGDVPARSRRPKSNPDARSLPRGWRVSNWKDSLTLLCIDTTGIIEDNALTCIPWQESISRAHELAGEKDMVWKPDSQGVIKKVSTQSGRYSVLALHTGEHEGLVELFFERCLAPATDGCSEVSSDRQRRADQEIWSQLAAETRAGIKRDADCHRPCDACSYLRVPPSSSGRQGRPTGRLERSAVAETNKRRRDLKTVVAAQAGNGSGEGPKGKGKGNVP